MIFHSVYLFILWCQCTGGENFKNISIVSVLDQLTIPTKFINGFLQKSVTIPPSINIDPNEYINNSKIHYANFNKFIPLSVTRQLYDSRYNNQNLTNIMNENLSTVMIKKLNLRNKVSLPSKEKEIFFNKSMLNHNRRLFFIDDKQTEIQSVKGRNNTPPFINYSLLSENIRKFPISNNFRFKTNLINFDKKKEQERGYRIKHNFRNDTHHRNLRGQLYKNIGHREKRNNTNENYKQNRLKIIRIKNNKGKLRISLQKPKDQIINTPISNLKTDVYNERNKEYKFRKPINFILKPKESVQSIVSASNLFVAKNRMDSINSKQDIYKPFVKVVWIDRNYKLPNLQEPLKENSDYVDEIDKSRIIRKIKQRHPDFYLSEKGINRDEEIYDSNYSDNEREYTTKSKSRYGQKSNSVLVMKNKIKYDNIGHNSDRDLISLIDTHSDNEHDTWNQASQNTEITNSKDFEINQIEKPKLHLVPVNILSNFDHASALDASQGFDFSNIMFTGFIQDGLAIGTSNPLYSSTNYIISSTIKPQVELATLLPDTTVDENLFHNSLKTVFIRNKLQKNIFDPSLQSSISPTVFAITPSPLHSTSSAVPSIQHILNKVQAPFLFHKQRFTVKPVRTTPENFLDSVQPNTNNQIYVKNTIEHKNLHSHFNTQSSSSQNNFNKPYSQNKAEFNNNDDEIFAVASSSIERNTKDDNLNSKRNSDVNYDSYTNIQNNQQTGQTPNAFLQTTLIPAILHSGIGFFNNQNQRFIPNLLFLTNPQSNQEIMKVKNDVLGDIIKQFQDNNKNNSYNLIGISSIDSVTAANNELHKINNIINPTQKPNLPIFGANNIEIINPNLKTNVINQSSARLATTPISIFATKWITSKNPFSSTIQESADNEQLYNPINFEPNNDLIRNQSILNSDIIWKENQKTNYIPLYATGKMYNDSQQGEDNLITRTKINADLEKYAEEMFKESLKTIYNSQKWNKDRRFYDNRSLVHNPNLIKLRNGLVRNKNNAQESKFPRDPLEAHRTESKIHITKPRYRYRKPNSSEEQYIFNNESYSKIVEKPHHYSNYQRYKSNINDFLTPPKINAFVSKNVSNKKPFKSLPNNNGLHLNNRQRLRH